MKKNVQTGFLLPFDNGVKKTLLVPYEENNLTPEQVLANKKRNDEYARRALLRKTKNTALGRAINEGKYDLVREALEKRRERNNLLKTLKR